MSRPEAGEERESPPTRETVALAREILDRVELLDVRPCAIHAELAEGVAPGEEVAGVDMDVAVSIAADEGIFGNRFDFTFLLNNDAEEEIGSVRFSLVIDY